MKHHHQGPITACTYKYVCNHRGDCHRPKLFLDEQIRDICEFCDDLPYCQGFTGDKFLCETFLMCGKPIADACHFQKNKKEQEQDLQQKNKQNHKQTKKATVETTKAIKTQKTNS